ncbi:MAG: hypothetical protein K8S97_15565, partial [Anaerolineae bacterium]|nr:hypothetical protein [Anaerolineae bacterium]
MAIASRRSLSPAVVWTMLLLVLIAAFGLRVWRLNAPSLWHDEAWSLRPLRDPITPTDESLPPRDEGWASFAYVEVFDYHYGNNTPPLYYALQYPLGRTAGDSLFALRYLGVLVDLLTIALAAQLLRRWAGWDAALLGAVLLSVSPLLWAYAREFRPYMAVPLLVLLLLWQVDLLLRAQREFPWRVWAALLLMELALLYTHNLSTPIVGWLNVIVLGVWLWHKRWRWIAIWSAGQAALLVVFLPWMGGQSPSGTALNTLPDFSPTLIWDIWQGYFAPLPTMVGAEDALIIGSAVVGVLVLLSAVVVVWRHRNQRTLLVLSQVLLLPVFSTLLLRGASIDFHPRYYILGVPAALMLLVLGVASLPPLPALRRVAAGGVLVVTVATGAASIDLLMNAPEYQHDDFRGIAEYYATLPDDALVIIPYSWEPTLDEYYIEKLGIRAEFLNLDLYGDADSAIQAINAALADRPAPVHVEYMNWFQLPADLRGMYPCLLEAAGWQVRTRYRQGLSSTYYEIEHPLALETIDNTAQYGVIDLTGAAQGGSRAICVQTTWTLQSATNDDLRLSARLQTIEPSGLDVAHSNTDIRNDKQESTSNWEPGEQGAAYSLLRLPKATPPGDYLVRLVVFGSQGNWLQSLNRLDNGVPAGGVFDLITVQSNGRTDEQSLYNPSTEGRSLQINDIVDLIGIDPGTKFRDAGTELRITLYWHVDDDCCNTQPWTDGTVILSGNDWELSHPVEAYAEYSLDWHTFRIPAEASGVAEVRIETEGREPVVVAQYSIQQRDVTLIQPPYDIPVFAQFDNLAVLIGITLDQTTISAGETLDLALVWRVSETPNVSYHVFTHLLDPDGRVIAQHDGMPVNYTRPTTGWVANEFISDPYALEFLPEFRDYRGPARLEIGFYDPETGDRVPVANGVDYIV